MEVKGVRWLKDASPKLRSEILRFANAWSQMERHRHPPTPAMVEAWQRKCLDMKDEARAFAAIQFSIEYRKETIYEPRYSDTPTGLIVTDREF